MAATGCTKRGVSWFTVPMLLIGLVAWNPGTAKADGQLRALLVGVSSYQQQMGFKPLNGPANDVALIGDQLGKLGFRSENIVILADGPRAKGKPTHDAIVRELDALAQTAGPGDIIYIHLSGHGSQQPNTNPEEDPEPDGKDEIFLPEDVGLWDKQAQGVKNAIVDDELAPRIAAIRNKKADVVFVADSCHSETLLRGSSVDEQDREQDRGIDPEQLGIPKSALDAAEARALGLRGGKQETAALEAEAGGRVAEGAGGLVAFYAAQRTESAPELPLPPDDPDRKVYGLLSFNFARMLAVPGITYRQAAEQILQNYRAENRSGPTPIVEGSDADLSKLVLGAEPGVASRQWPIQADKTTWRIPAGQLHQVSQSTILAIVPAATTVNEADILGYARVSEAKTLSSTIEPIAYNDKPAPTEIPTGAFARMVDARFELRLTVALPERSTAPSPAETGAWRELDRLQQDGLKDTTIDWVEPASASAHLRLLVRDDKLWLLPPSGALVTEGPGRTPFLTIPTAARGGDDEALTRFREELGESLRKVAKVVTLFAMAKDLSGNELARDLEINLAVKRAGGTETKKIGVTEALDLYDGDMLRFEVINNSHRPVDLTVLFIDSRQRIEPWFPYSGQSNRLTPQGGKASEELVVNLKTVGTEHFLFIAAAAESQAPRTDFSFLAQEGLRGRSGEASRQSTISDLLRQAGSQGLRGGGHPPVTLATASLFDWRVVPAEER
jgi:hypothetical protein